MKKCPTCKMTVNADNECPFCYTSIIYEKETLSDKEEYVWNKYFVWYLIKQSWFSLLCFIIVTIRLFYIRDALDAYVIVPTLFLLVSFIFSLFGRKITSFMYWKYSEDYSAFRTVLTKVIAGALAVLFSFVMR